MANSFLTVTFTPGDLEFLEELVEFVQDILDAAVIPDEDDE